MVLTVHHLGISQSERVVFLCEELGIPYELKLHTRSPMLAPDSLKNIPGNATGRSPFIQDSDANITLSESGAILEYLIHGYGGGRLSAKPSDAHYPDYLHWFHWSNASLQAAISGTMWPVADANLGKMRDARLGATLKVMDDRLAQSKWLAGDEFTAADIMPTYTLITGRYWSPVDLSPYPNIVRWIGDIAARPGYQRAMQKGDPQMRLLLGPEAPEKSLLQLGGTEANVWKK